jgi:hypothetical protein
MRKLRRSWSSVFGMCWANGSTSVRFGVTSFPEDGFTLDELFDLAAERARPGRDVGQGCETADSLRSYGRATES